MSTEHCVGRGAGADLDAFTTRSQLCGPPHNSKGTQVRCIQTHIVMFTQYSKLAEENRPPLLCVCVLGRATATGKKKGGGGGGETQLQVSPDAGPELQEALEVCERGLGGAGKLALGTRAALLAVWVQCKQLLQQPISSKTLGIDTEVTQPLTILHILLPTALPSTGRRS